MPRLKRRTAHCKKAGLASARKRQERPYLERGPSPIRPAPHLERRPSLPRRSPRLRHKQVQESTNSCSCFPKFTCERCMSQLPEIGDVPIARFWRHDIGGEGLRALTNIEPDTFIIEYRGKPSAKEISGSYVLKISQLWIDGAIGGNESKYINHSCDPNCIMFVEPFRQRPMIFSSKPILIGEELTIKYSVELPFICRCAKCAQCNNS